MEGRQILTNDPWTTVPLLAFQPQSIASTGHGYGGPESPLGRSLSPQASEAGANDAVPGTWHPATVPSSAEAVATAFDLVLEAAILALDDASGAVIAVMESEGNDALTCASNDLAAQAHGIEETLGHGPGLAAWTSGRPVGVEDVRTDGRWREWARAVTDLGVRACVGVPLLADRAAVGTLSVYWEMPLAASPRLIRLLEVLAAQTSLALSDHHSRSAVTVETDHLAAALDRRRKIITAVSLMVADGSLQDDEAMQILLGRARKHGKPLLEIAEEVIASRGREVPGK